VSGPRSDPASSFDRHLELLLARAHARLPDLDQLGGGERVEELIGGARACWKRASTSDASAAVCPALAARFSAPRRKPVKRSMLALSDVLTLRLVLQPLSTCPVTGSTGRDLRCRSRWRRKLAVTEGR
jgi:hypothetical protein